MKVRVREREKGGIKGQKMHSQILDESYISSDIEQLSHRFTYF